MMVRINGKNMLPIKYCIPDTEEVISTRNVCFSFSSAMAVPTIINPSQQILMEIPIFRSRDISIGESSPPEFIPYNILKQTTIPMVRTGPSIIAVFFVIQIHLICATAANLLKFPILNSSFSDAVLCTPNITYLMLFRLPVKIHFPKLVRRNGYIESYFVSSSQKFFLHFQDFVPI